MADLVILLHVYVQYDPKIKNYKLLESRLINANIQDNKMKPYNTSLFILLMQQEIRLQNEQVANIYQSMLEGHHDALYKLQNINIKQHPRFVQHNSYPSNKVNTEQNSQKLSIQNQEQSQYKAEHAPHQRKQIKGQQVSGVESRLQSNLNKLKQEMYMNILKKGPKLQTILKNQNRQHHIRQKKWINSSNSQHQNILKRISQQSLNKEKQSETQFSVQIKPNVSTHLPPNKNNRLYPIPKSTKFSELPKVQSANIEPPKITVNNVQKSMVAIKPRKTEKADFKQMINKSKMHKAQLQRKNEEQLDFQLKLVEFHKETKERVEAVRTKYELNFNNRHKYLRKKKKDQLSSQLRQSESSEKLSPFKVKYQSEKAKCQQHYSDINSLKLQFNNNLGLLAKLQVAINNNSFNRYYKNHSYQIYEEDQEQQEDTVQPLQTAQQKNKKYTKLMAHTRQKKWGLMQRTEYESQRAQQLYQSRKTGINSRLTLDEQQKLHYQTSKQNKVTVNERLKLLLFN